jgi:predicted O-linked N-acetylglucosamine transferase (SPINDLY family)
MVSWVKSHKLLLLLVVIIVFLVLTKESSISRSNLNSSYLPVAKQMPESGGKVETSMSLSDEAAPIEDVANRMVIKSSNLSLLVTKVDDAQKKILKKIEDYGGYMVSVELSNPQDVATATVIVRVPAKTLDQALEYIRSVSTKVISENLEGYDVTDEYTDLQANLDTLNKTKAKFEQIMDRASLIPDIIEVQRELISIQSQIDSIKGQQQYYEKNAEMSKITIYLSTDEFSLPYAPSESWKPQTIFKQAIRSLIGALRSIGTLVIWIVVYSIIWVPALLIIKLIRRKRIMSK